MNETPAPAPLDQAAFQRVWQRVMPEDRPDCPFTVEPPAIPAVDPPPPQPMTRIRTDPTPPPVCLGEASAGELPTLGCLLKQAVDSYRIYHSLIRRAGREPLPAALSAAKRKQARRLSAAYFLISGKNHSIPPTPAPQSNSLPLVLRAQYQAEQQAALSLFSAANASADPCLIELYRALAAENQSHASQLRSWLEKM